MLLAVLLVVSGISMPASAADNVTGWSGADESVYEGEGYSVAFRLTGRWNGGYNASVTVMNTGAAEIENWKLSFPFSGNISSIWNAKVMENGDGEYVISNPGYSRNIPADGRAEFGFTGTGDFPGFPEVYRMPGAIGISTPDDFSADYRLESDWGYGFVAGITLTNISSETIEDWKLSFSYDRNITNVWNAETVSHDGNTYLLKNAGYNADLKPGESVYIGFNGNGGTSEDRPRGFELTSSVLEGTGQKADYSTASIYDLITFSDTDSELCVTRDIILEKTYEGEDVTWTSDRPDIISEEGIVARPYEESETVTLTAHIGTGKNASEQSFRVKVVKTLYEDLTYDDIPIMDDLNQIYFYNPDTDKVSIFKTPDGYLDSMGGSISDIQVESPYEAMLALYGVKELLGLSSFEDEVYVKDIFRGNSSIVIEFGQNYQGIPVYDTFVRMYTDEQGNITGLKNSLISIDMDVTPDITMEQAAAKAAETWGAGTDSAELNIYFGSSAEPKLVWNVACGSEPCFYSILVDAHSGEVLLTPEITLTAKKPVTEMIPYTDDISFPVTTHDPTGTFDRIYGSYEEASKDKGRQEVYVLDASSAEIDNIETAPLQNLIGLGNNPTIEYKDSLPMNTDAIDALLNVIRARDYYYSKEFDKFGRYETVTKNRKTQYNNQVYICINAYGTPNACYSARQYGDNVLNYILFVDSSDGCYKSSPDEIIAAHEYTHGLLRAYNTLSGYDVEAGAIDEAYADTMAYLINGRPQEDWVITDGKQVIRNSSEAVTISPSFDRSTDYTSGTCHSYSVVLSHAFNLMLQKGLSPEKLELILLDSIKEAGFTPRTMFEDVGKALYNDVNLTPDEKKIVLEAFTDSNLDITYDSDKVSYVISGKTAMYDSKKDIEAYPSAEGIKVKITKENNPNVYFESVFSGADGRFTVSVPCSGIYILEFIDGNIENVSMPVRVFGTNVELGTVALLPTIASPQIRGVAKGRVVNSITGEGVPGLTYTICSGYLDTAANGTSKLGTYAAKGTTDDDGYYNVGSLKAGYYTIVVRDERAGISKGDKYVTVSRHIVVSGDGSPRNQDVVVSTGLQRGQLRIVLEWGASPSDLDSHLKGAKSLGDGYRYSEEFHVAFYNRSVTGSNGAISAFLDLDDIDGYGPETTTIYNPDEDMYCFYVYQWSSEAPLTTSNAKVSVYKGTGSGTAAVYSVPVAGHGRYWLVFKYDPKTNRIISINEILETEPVFPN